MIATIRRPITMACMVAAIFTAVTITSSCAWAGASGAFFDDDPNEDTAPIAGGDFNRDGIADIAEATLLEGNPSGTAFLTVLMRQKDGSYRQLASNPALGRDPKTMVVGDL